MQGSATYDCSTLDIDGCKDQIGLFGSDLNEKCHYGLSSSSDPHLMTSENKRRLGVSS